MKIHKIILLGLFSSFLLLVGCNQSADVSDTEIPKKNPHEKEVVEQVQAYIDVLNNGTADQMVSFWADDVVYRNPITENFVHGKEELKEEFRSLDNRLEGSQSEVEVKKVEFPFEDKAVVEGVLTVSRPNSESVITEFKISLVQQDGKWQIVNVSNVNLGGMEEAPDHDPMHKEVQD